MESQNKRAPLALAEAGRQAEQPQPLVPEGRGAWLSGMALKKALPFPSLPQIAKVLQEMERYRKEEPALGPTFTTYRGFPNREQGWAASLCLKVLEAAQMLSDRGDFD